MAHPGKYEDFTAPWGDGEIDVEKVKRLVWNARVAEHEAGEKLATAQAELTKAKQEHETADQKAAREAAELREKAEKSGDQALENARLRIALEKKLTLAQAKRLVGTTEAELLADADEYIKEHNIGGDAGSGSGEEGSGKPPVQQRPSTSNLRTGAENDADPQDDLSDPRKLLPPRRR